MSDSKPYFSHHGTDSSKYWVTFDGRLVGTVQRKTASVSAPLWIAKRKGGAVLGIFGTRHAAADALRPAADNTNGPGRTD